MRQTVKRINIIKIIRRAVAAVLGIALIAGIYLIAAQRLSGEQAPEIFGFRQAAVVSGSMEPVCSPGDYIIYREKDAYQVGDIILFQKDGSLITHRIVEAAGQEFVTKGDANNTADEEHVSREEILGEAVFVLPHVGSVFLFLRSPLGILILLGSALALMWMPSRRKEKE